VTDLPGLVHCPQCGSLMVQNQSNELWVCLNEECGDGYPEALAELGEEDFLAATGEDEDLVEELCSTYSITFCDTCGSAYHYIDGEQWECFDCNPDFNPEEGE